MLTDQAAVDLVAKFDDPQEAAEALLKEALANHSMDNISVMVVLFCGPPEGKAIGTAAH